MKVKWKEGKQASLKFVNSKSPRCLDMIKPNSKRELDAVQDFRQPAGSMCKTKNRIHRLFPLR